MAIAGDYISAASFLGIVGAIALNGYDGFLYSIGFLVSYLVVMFLIAEPIHHLGKYSLGDVLAARFPSNKIRVMMAFSTLDRKSTRLNSSHVAISYAVFCLKKKTQEGKI